MIEPGTEQIYRLSEFAPSERVRVVAIDQRKKTPRYEVEFVDGEKAGTVENVPAGRLHGPWSGVEGYDEYMAHWQRFLDEEPLDSTEDGAIGHVFQEVVSDSIAELDWKYSRCTTIVKDRVALAALIGVTAGEVLDQLDTSKESSHRGDHRSFSALVGQLIYLTGTARCGGAPIAATVGTAVGSASRQ